MTTKTGHYARCHFATNENFLDANRPETSRTQAAVTTKAEKARTGVSPDVIAVPEGDR